MYQKILTLSNCAVINFINGLFGTEYSTDSKITYNWTENHDDELNRTIADGILTINDKVSYHIEAQMGEDEEMQFRVFEYGYRLALNRRNGTDMLEFPEPMILKFREQIEKARTNNRKSCKKCLRKCR